MTQKEKELILSFVRLLEFERDEMKNKDLRNKIEKSLDWHYCEFEGSNDHVADDIIDIIKKNKYIDYRQLYRDFVLGKTSKMQ